MSQKNMKQSFFEWKWSVLEEAAEPGSSEEQEGEVADGVVPDKGWDCWKVEPEEEGDEASS